jgi:hypothetical protein
MTDGREVPAGEATRVSEREPMTDPVSPAPEPALDPDRAPASATEPEPVQSGLDTCATEASFNRCVIQAVPNPRNRRELGTVAQAYYEMGNIPRACQFMRRYVARYLDARARQFNQMLLARCSDPVRDAR